MGGPGVEIGANQPELKARKPSVFRKQETFQEGTIT